MWLIRPLPYVRHKDPLAVLTAIVETLGPQ
jgi:hypothetical protein